MFLKFRSQYFYRVIPPLAGLLLNSFFFQGCKMKPENSPDKLSVIQAMAASHALQTPHIKNITPSEILEIQQDLNKKDSFLLVDVRPEEERKVSMIPSSLSLESFQQKIQNQNSSLDQTRMIILYDTIGLRSTQTIDSLQLNHLQIFNLKGGLLNWLWSGGKLVDQNNNEVWKVHVHSEPWNLVPEHYQGIL